MGRFHTNWLNMMFPRLRLAANLLRDDGVIFISIDDNEIDNLKKLCNEVFGEENFIAQLIWERAYSPKNDAKYISNSHDYVLMYAKKLEDFKIGRLPRTEEANARYSNPDNDPRGEWKSTDMSVKTFSESGNYPITTPTGNVVYPPAGRCWSLSRSTFEEKLKDNRISFGANGDGAPRIKTFLSELKYDGMSPTSILFYKDVGHSQEGRQELKKLFDDKGYFDGPKPIRLLNRLLTLANVQNDDIILDFFSGSATTAHAVMQLNAEDGGNRQFICVQLPELCSEKSEAFKAGYKNICEIGKERIRRAGKKILGNCNNQSVCNVEVNSPPLEGCRDSGGVVRNTKNYMELPYNPTLKEKSRELRKAGNLSEVLLWQQIKNKQFNNLDFDRQKIIGNYIVYFYCASKNIVIEIDGISHDEKQKYDETRDNYLKSLGLEVIHILDIDVYKNLDGVIKNLNNYPALTSTPPKEGNPVTPDSINHKTSLDIGFKVFKLDTSNLAKWDSTPIENNDEKVLI